MSDMMENKLNADELEAVAGGMEREEIHVRPIKPMWVKVTASSLIIKTYEYNHKLKVDGITEDGKWYRLLVDDPRGGMIYGFIYKEYTETL